MSERFERIAAAGYDGVEARMPAPEDEAEFKRLLKQYGMVYVAQIGRDGGTIDSFTRNVERAAGFEPMLINSHSFRHDANYEEQLDYFHKAIEVEKRIGIKVGHETHRGRAMYTPWSTERLLKDIPELHITADFSHWCVVCESLLEDQAHRLQLSCERAIHIHGRVGYAEGPQVACPAAPEFQAAVEAHFQWWEQIYNHKRQRGDSAFTVSIELGQTPYQQTLPYTLQPVSDTWSDSLWLANQFRARLASLSNSRLSSCCLSGMMCQKHCLTYKSKGKEAGA